jgi:protein-tyrosine phosphatase
MTSDMSNSETTTRQFLESASIIIPDRLYFLSLAKPPTERQVPDLHFFTADNKLRYEPFASDFGPLNIGQIYVFCATLSSKLKDPALASQQIMFYSAPSAHARSNAAVLIGAFGVLVLGKSAEEAYQPFLGIYPPFLPFRDASSGPSTFNLSVLDVLRGLHRARVVGLVDFATWDNEEYAFYERVVNGDITWMVPGKILAFSGPVGNPLSMEHPFTPEDYCPYFKKRMVQAVVRLNKKRYPRTAFTRVGIRHYDLFFPDGSVPSEAIVRSFLEIVETEPHAVAVHCRAGLGRTGTLIGCYLMKQYRFTAPEAIAYMRVIRPGSVLGPQQHFLAAIQPRMWRQGDVARAMPAVAASKAAVGGGTGSPLFSHDVAAGIRELQVRPPAPSPTRAPVAAPASHPISSPGGTLGKDTTAAPAFASASSRMATYVSGASPGDPHGLHKRPDPNPPGKQKKDILAAQAAQAARGSSSSSSDRYGHPPRRPEFAVGTSSPLRAPSTGTHTGSQPNAAAGEAGHGHYGRLAGGPAAIAGSSLGR